MKTAATPRIDFELPAAAVRHPMMGGGRLSGVNARIASDGLAALGDWRKLVADNTGLVTPGLPGAWVDWVRELPRGRTELDAEHPIEWEGDPASALIKARGDALLVPEQDEAGGDSA